MKTRILIVILLFALTVMFLPASAQEAPPGRRVLELQVSAAPTEPPTVESAGYTGVFKIHPVGTVTGDLEGSFSHHVTQVDPIVNLPSNTVNDFLDTTSFFTIETEDGTIEGYYFGAFYFPEKDWPDAIVRQQGRVLSVTAAYAHLYLADVYYDSIVDFEEVDGILIPQGDSGTMIIAPR